MIQVRFDGCALSRRLGADTPVPMLSIVASRAGGINRRSDALHRIPLARFGSGDCVNAASPISPVDRRRSRYAAFETRISRALAELGQSRSDLADVGAVVEVEQPLDVRLRYRHSPSQLGGTDAPLEHRLIEGQLGRDERGKGHGRPAPGGTWAWKRLVLRHVRDQCRDQAVLGVRHGFPLVGTVCGRALDVGESDHEAAVLIGGQGERICVAHDTALSPELGRINTKVLTHLSKQAFPDLLLEILDRGPSSSEVHDSMAAATPAGIHLEGPCGASGRAGVAFG